MNPTPTTVPGLTLYENFLPEDIHQQFIHAMKEGTGIQERGLLTA